MADRLLFAALAVGVVTCSMSCDRTLPSTPAPTSSSTPAVEAPPPTTTASAAAPKTPPPRREGGALARSPTEKALYLADEDHGVLRRIPLPVDVQNKGAEVKLPGRPAQVLALADKILVTVRDPGLLLVMSADATPKEIARVALPDDAWGLAISADQSTAFVTSAWTHKVSAIDLAKGAVRWTLDVPREPRAVVSREGSLYVTHLVGAGITKIDGALGAEPKASTVDLPADPLRTRLHFTTSASLAYSAVLSPDQKRLFVPRHALNAGVEAWQGTSTVDVLETADDSPVAPKRALPALGTMTLEDLKSGNPTVDPAGALATSTTTAFVQPRAVAYRARTRTLLIASEGNDAVVEVDALSIAPSVVPLKTYSVSGKVPDDQAAIKLPASCGAPTGLALSEDEDVMWVYCRSTNDLVIVTLDPHGTGKPPEHGPTPWVRLVEDTGPVALGKQLYYNATESTVSGGLGCAGCHPEGRDDGHTWHELKQGPYAHEGSIFVSGIAMLGGEKDWFSLKGKDDKDVPQGYARQTPMLAGRVTSNGPYGWHAESADLKARVKGGFLLHRWWSLTTSAKSLTLRAEPIVAFLREGLVPPPHRERALTPEEEKGKAIFLSDQTRCATCHAVNGGEYTDRSAIPLVQKKPPQGYDEDPNPSFKTPSLRFVHGSPPYFHDGSAQTLDDVVNKNFDRMGKTSHLNADERAALVAFLRTL